MGAPFGFSAVLFNPWIFSTRFDPRLAFLSLINNKVLRERNVSRGVFFQTRRGCLDSLELISFGFGGAEVSVRGFYLLEF